MENVYYVYAYLDPRKPGNYVYGEYSFRYEPFYIGKGKNNRINKSLEYKYNNYKNYRNNLKYGKIDHILEVGLKPIVIKCKENLSEQEAFELEKRLIGIIGRINLGKGPLSNLTNGGEGSSGVIVFEETRKKLSQTSNGRKHSEESKRKRSESMMGEKNSFYGKCHTDEYKKKRSESQKGKKKPYNAKPLSEKHKKKLSESHSGEKNYWFGKHRSKETKEKLSELNKGEKHPMYGKHQSDEAKIKISNAQRGEKNHNYGNHLSEDVRKKISDSVKQYFASKKNNI